MSSLHKIKSENISIVNIAYGATSIKLRKAPKWVKHFSI